MAILNLLQLFQTDDQATLIDKINYNLDQILSIGGGPPGATGIQGIQGIPGGQGVQGFQGNAGDDGSYWFVQPSTVTPSIPSPKSGDLWLQTDNNNILRYEGSPLTWTVVGNLSAPNQTGVIRSNGNIYVAGDEDGAGPGLDGDTILAYDPVDNEERGNVIIHGDIITGLTQPAGWITHPVDNSDVGTVVGNVTDYGSGVQSDRCFLTYKIIGKTVHLSFQLNDFITTTGGGGDDADVFTIVLPSALQGVKPYYEDTVFWDTAPLAGVAGNVWMSNGHSMGYYQDKGRTTFFPVYITIVKTDVFDPLYGAEKWMLCMKPLDTLADNTRVYNGLAGGTESLFGSITFEIE